MMKYIFYILLVFLPVGALASTDIELPGRYVLQGAPEDSTLLIKDNGRFEAVFSYGNLDGHVAGTWKRNDKQLSLYPEGESPVIEFFKDLTLAIGKHCLIKDLGEYKACYLRQPELPFSDGWYLGFMAPDYMDVWVESVVITDTRGVKQEGPGGIVAISQPENGEGNANGWGGPYVWGKGISYSRLDLPNQIFVRWQSLVEPQTYRATLDIPQSARDLMLKREKVECATTPPDAEYRRAVIVGLAPSGIAKLWVTGPCFKGEEVLRVQAEVEPKGPYGGKSEGRYRPLEPAAKAYIEKHGIPYGSW
jgi:hypothetical protein